MSASRLQTRVEIITKRLNPTAGPEAPVQGEVCVTPPTSAGTDVARRSPLKYPHVQTRERGAVGSFLSLGSLIANLKPWKMQLAMTSRTSRMARRRLLVCTLRSDRGAACRSTSCAALSVQVKGVSPKINCNDDTHATAYPLLDRLARGRPRGVDGGAGIRFLVWGRARWKGRRPSI